MRKIEFCRKSFINKSGVKSMLKKGLKMSSSKLLKVNLQVDCRDSVMSEKEDSNSENASNRHSIFTKASNSPQTSKHRRFSVNIATRNRGNSSFNNFKSPKRASVLVNRGVNLQTSIEENLRSRVRLKQKKRYSINVGDERNRLGNLFYDRPNFGHKKWDVENGQGFGEKGLFGLKEEKDFTKSTESDKEENMIHLEFGTNKVGCIDFIS